MKFLRWIGDLIRANLGNSIFLFLLAAALISWIAYTHATGDGVVTGKVVNAQGKPVAGATVLIREKTLSLIKPPVDTTTNDEGVFTFHHISMIQFLLSARKAGFKTSPNASYHLYFKTQHFRVPKPLVLTAE